MSLSPLGTSINRYAPARLSPDNQSLVDKFIRDVYGAFKQTAGIGTQVQYQGAQPLLFELLEYLFEFI